MIQGDSSNRRNSRQLAAEGSAALLQWARQEMSPTEYIMQANKALLIIVQIETREALENVSAALVLNYYEDTLG
jgi:2-keto-3-deoxy-L-rhamnonate aldolase RhmA